MEAIEHDVVITTYKGLLSATISGISGRFVIQKNGRNYQLLKINLAGMPSHQNDIEISSTANFSEVHSGNPSDNNIESKVSNLKFFSQTNIKNSNNNRDAINPNVIDLLIVYNELSRIEACGGSCSSPSDTLAIEQKIIAEVDNLNYALDNSESSTNFTNFHMAKVSDFSHASGSGDQSSQTLNNFRALASVSNLRNQVGADLVVGLIDTNAVSFPWCGKAFGQTLVDSNGPWTVGAGFSEYAYSITASWCLLYDYTFSHEIGHNMGANHQRSESSTGAINNATNNGFPDAFAYQNGNFISVTSSAGGSSRNLNFSNPDVQVNGVNTGIVNLANNKRVIDDLTVHATNYRQRPDVIFVDGFE